VLADELVDHLGASLRPLADRHGGLGADDAGLGLTVAEIAHVGDRSGRSPHGAGGIDIGLRAGLPALLCTAAR
jgi:hypothetical protein